MDLAKLVVRLEAQTAQYQASLEKAQRQLGKFDKSAASMASRIGRSFALAIAGAAVGLAAMGKNALENADRLNKMSQSVGISTESLSQLEYAAELADVGSEELAKSLKKLSTTARDAAEGSKKAKEGFAQLGIEVQNADGSIRESDELLLDLADKFSKLKDGTAKAAIAVDFFGRSGLKMIPFLNQGRDGIQELMKEADRLGLTLSGSAALAAEEFNDNLKRMSSVVTGLTNQALQQMLPMMSAMAESFVQAAKSGGSLEVIFKGLAGFMKGLVSAGVIVSSVFQQLGRVIYGVGAGLVSFVKGDFQIAAAEIKDAFKDASANATNDMESVARIWGDLVPAMEKVATDTDGELKKSLLFNDKAAAEAAAKARDAALKAISGIATGLRQEILSQEAALKQLASGQTASLAMVEKALIVNRIANGDLTEEFEKLGEAGNALEIELTDLATRHGELAQLIEEETTRQAGWNAAIESSKELVKGLRTPVEEYSAALEELVLRQELGLIVQKDFNRAAEEAQQKFLGFSDPVQMYADRLSELKTALNDGIISQAQYNQAVAESEAAFTGVENPQAAYQQRIMELNDALAAGLLTQEKYNEAVVQAQDSFGRALDKSNVFLKKASENVQDIIADNLISGFEDGAKGMLSTFADMLRDMAAQALAAKIAESIFGTSGVGSSGGIIGAVVGAISAGGSRDSGGRGSPGKSYMIGTGAQPEMFVPDRPGTFIPQDKMNPNITVSPQIINVKDPSEIPSAMQSREGEQAILNVLSRNPSTIRNLMQRG